MTTSSYFQIQVQRFRSCPTFRSSPLVNEGSPKIMIVELKDNMTRHDERKTYHLHLCTKQG